MYGHWAVSSAQLVQGSGAKGEGDGDSGGHDGRGADGGTDGDGDGGEAGGYGRPSGEGEEGGLHAPHVSGHAWSCVCVQVGVADDASDAHVTPVLGSRMPSWQHRGGPAKLQSVQSVPRAQSAYTAPMPPSSHEPSLRYAHWAASSVQR